MTSIIHCHPIKISPNASTACIERKRAVSFRALVGSSECNTLFTNISIPIQTSLKFIVWRGLYFLFQHMLLNGLGLILVPAANYFGMPPPLKGVETLPWMCSDAWYMHHTSYSNRRWRHLGDHGPPPSHLLAKMMCSLTRGSAKEALVRWHSNCSWSIVFLLICLCDGYQVLGQVLCCVMHRTILHSYLGEPAANYRKHPGLFR